MGSRVPSIANHVLFAELVMVKGVLFHRPQGPNARCLGSGHLGSDVGIFTWLESGTTEPQGRAPRFRETWPAKFSATSTASSDDIWRPDAKSLLNSPRSS